MARRLDRRPQEGPQGGPRKRKRSIISFGGGAKAKAAAEAYRDEIAPKVKVAQFWERQTATFALLWEKFDAQLVGPMPGPATIADYRSIAANYLLPELGGTLLKDIDAEFLTGYRSKLLTEPGLKASVAAGSQKPLSPRTVAKILTLIGTVFRFRAPRRIYHEKPCGTFECG